MSLLELIISNGDVVEVDEDDITMIDEQSHLESIFNGTSLICVDSDGCYDLYEMAFDVDDEDFQRDRDFYEGHHRVTGARWSFNGSKFDVYVRELMNEQEIDGVFGILEGGINSGYTELIYTAKAVSLFNEYKKNIESVVSDLVDGLGESILVDKDGDFSIARLAVMAVEETIRAKIQSIIEY